MKKQMIRIMKLGDVIFPELMLGIDMLKDKTGLSTQDIFGFLKQEEDLIWDFKLGYFKKEDGTKEYHTAEYPRLFSETFVNKLNTKYKTSITVQDFEDAWHKMNPHYDKYKEKLAEAFQFNNQPNCRLIFMTESNFFDESDMEKEFAKYGIKFDPEVPTDINGIKLYASNDHHEKAPKLLELIDKKIHLMPASLVGKFFEDKWVINKKYLDKSNKEYKFDIAYIYRVSKQPGIASTPQEEILAKCEALGFQTHIWKENISLIDTLNYVQPKNEEKKDYIDQDGYVVVAAPSLG